MVGATIGSHLLHTEDSTGVSSSGDDGCRQARKATDDGRSLASLRLVLPGRQSDIFPRIRKYGAQFSARPIGSQRVSQGLGGCVAAGGCGGCGRVGGDVRSGAWCARGALSAREEVNDTLQIQGVIFRSCTITVQIESASEPTRAERVPGYIDELGLHDIWLQLGVGEQRWKQWHAAVRNGRAIVFVEDSPQLSRLASADEGRLVYGREDLTDLEAECQRVKRITNGRAEFVIDKLLMAVRESGQQDDIVVIHPFG